MGLGELSAVCHSYSFGHQTPRCTHSSDTYNTFILGVKNEVGLTACLLND